MKLRRHQLSFTLLVSIEQVLSFVVHDTPGQILPNGQYIAPRKVIKLHLLAHLLTYLVVRLQLFSLRQRNLTILIVHLAIRHHLADAPYLKVSLLDVDYQVKITITPVIFCQHHPKNRLQDVTHRLLVYVLLLFKILQCLNELLAIHRFPRLFIKTNTHAPDLLQGVRLQSLY